MPRAALGLLVISWMLGGEAAAESGAVRGRVEIDAHGLSLDQVRPLVVFLEAEDGSESERPGPGASRRIEQRNARFVPDFLVMVAGERLELPNVDVIFHNVFSYSYPNAFDVGLYRNGEARSVTLRHPGLVRLYCAIHESMNATVLVVPSIHFGRAGAAGEFHLPDVPPGHYRLTTWSDLLPSERRAIEVRAQETTRVQIRIHARTGRARSTGGP